ncbi:microtubule-associated protein 9-like isoform X3 [Dreissena polymorpha]|uniref:microtubule-associated protein 9-like isoform X3 n=1 Tax=Dreissena polymorpha TaxID=45954 RepID=UPI002265352A|nr:microtubule-associated protein 9-like isoform X3 [Dreissena polymorpha]
MDTPDASVYSATTKRQREQLPKTSLQQELNAKMKERKKLGLSADLTSEESSGLDSEEENSLTMEFRARTTIRSDRPSSAKRRGKLDLGDTLKPGEANRFLKTAKKDQMSTLRESPPLKGSSGFPKDNSPGRDIDKMFGTLASKGRTSPSPLDSRFGMDTVDAPIYSAKHRKSPAEDGMLTGSRKSPVSPSLGLLPSGKNAPARELTKEEKIFGVKTGPGKDRESPKEKEWKAPNFRQSPVLGQERATPSPDIGKAGRKTPDIGLQTITESPRPVPRTLAKDTKLKSRDSSPRSLSLESPKSERPKPKVDIFGGKKDKTIEFADEPEKTPSSRERRRFGREEKPLTPGRKTPTKAGEPTGRTTPTLRKSPALSGRLTPTSAKASKTAEEPKKKEPGLFDFLTEDKKDDKKEEKKESTPKPRLGRDRRQTNLKKSESHDSITEELGADQPSILEESTRDQRIPVDQSSVCADLDKDPDRERVRKEEKEKQFAGYSNQRSDRKEAADIISRVEDAQSQDPKQMTKQRPASAKADTLVKPQPRHSLPGSRPSSAVASERLEMFNTTMSIRQTIFEEWRMAKAKEIKQKKLEEEKKKEAEEKKKQKEKQDKVLENRASYEAWMKERGKSFVEEQKLKKKEEEKKLKKEEEEKHNKKKDAKKNFEKWKESKDALIIEEHKKAIEEKHKKKQEERAKQKDKEKTNETAFKGWKERKDKVIEQNVAKQKEAKLEIKKKEEEEQKEKERQAMRDYNDWLKKKEEQERREADFRRTQQIREEHGEAEFRPPWSPASKIIPCGR